MVCITKPIRISGFNDSHLWILAIDPMTINNELKTNKVISHLILEFIFIITAKIGFIELLQAKKNATQMSGISKFKVFQIISYNQLQANQNYPQLHQIPVPAYQIFL